MDGRILLAASSLVGATLGVTLMALTAPDTGMEPTAATMAPVTALSAPPRNATPDISRPMPPATRPSTRPSTPPSDKLAEHLDKVAPGKPAPGENPFAQGWGDPGDNPFGDPAKGSEDAGDNPFAAAAEGNPFGAPAADNPFAIPADQDNPFGADAAAGWGDGWGEPVTRSASDPLPTTTPPDRQPQAPALLGAKEDLPGDVRGVGRLFRERDAIVKQCMSRDAPEALPNERRVMIRVYLSARSDNPAKAGIQKIEAPKDDGGRYTAFLSCLTSAVSDAVFELPSQGAASVNWSLRR